MISSHQIRVPVQYQGHFEALSSVISKGALLEQLLILGHLLQISDYEAVSFHRENTLPLDLLKYDWKPAQGHTDTKLRLRVNVFDYQPYGKIMLSILEDSDLSKKDQNSCLGKLIDCWLGLSIQYMKRQSENETLNVPLSSYQQSFLAELSSISEAVKKLSLTAKFEKISEVPPADPKVESTENKSLNLEEFDMSTLSI